jgi:DNA polymerase-3 subunit delta
MTLSGGTFAFTGSTFQIGSGTLGQITGGTAAAAAGVGVLTISNGLFSGSNSGTNATINVGRTAHDMGVAIEPAAAEALAEAIGSDSARLASELEKLSLYAGTGKAGGPGAPITAAAVAALIGSHATSSLQVGDALLAGQSAEAIALVDQLLEVNEPALRIVAALSSQIRGWLWVSLLDAQGEQDVVVIAKAAGIGNPKRIYVMRKQIRGRPPGRFLRLLGQLLEVEAALKRGSEPGDAFRDGFLLAGP